MGIPFTLVSTVFNEKKRIDQTIADLANQSLQPSEIIITDAGSNDGTYEALTDWSKRSPVPIKILVMKGCNVAQGRNLAIQHAAYDLIVSTDFGCRFHPDWLKSIVTPFNDNTVKAVGGNYTVNEPELVTLAEKAGYILSGGYQIDVNYEGFIPSSRSIAYYKDVFEKAGGYPEWLTLAGDDTTFGKLVRKCGITFYKVPEPYVYWGRHKVAKGYVKEAFRYGLGDGEAHVNQRNFVSNTIETLIRYLFFASILIITAAVATGNLPAVYWLLPLLFLPGLRSYVNYTTAWLRFKSPKYNWATYFYGLILLERTRINYIKGYLKGYFRSGIDKKERAKQLAARLNA